MNQFDNSISMEATKNCLEPSDPTGRKYHGSIKYENTFASIYNKNEFQHINRGKLLSEVGPESPIALQELLSETEKKRETWVLGES